MLLLGLPNVAAGLWAVIAPENWFENFPGWAPQLVAAYPPFNEHLASDAGAGLLASGVLMVLAALWPKREVAVVAAIGFLAFALPHFLFHVLNPSDELAGSENAVSTGSLAFAVVGAGTILMWQWFLKPSRS